jgi:phage baseplate assembly protein W
MTLKRIEPGRTGVSLTTTVARDYKDLDLSFSPKRGTMFEDGIRRGDVYKKEDIRAIDQSIKTILLTNRYEKPFQPLFGADLRRLLFGLSTQVSEDEVRDTIIDALRKHEPRVQVLGVDIYDAGAAKQVPRGIEDVFFYSVGADPARYSLIITVHCRIKTTGVDITTQVNMNRLR